MAQGLSHPSLQPTSSCSTGGVSGLPATLPSSGHATSAQGSKWPLSQPTAAFSLNLARAMGDTDSDSSPSFHCDHSDFQLEGNEHPRKHLELILPLWSSNKTRLGMKYLQLITSPINGRQERVNCLSVGGRPWGRQRCPNYGRSPPSHLFSSDYMHTSA